MKYEVKTMAETLALGRALGRRLRGGECIELLGDVGAGKTTFVKGMAEGLAIEDDIQSPSFTLSREYDTPSGLRLVHYDFYRLHDAGLMAYELAESLEGPHTVTVVEWAETIGAVLPELRLKCQITAGNGEARIFKMEGPAELVRGLI